MTPDPVSVTPTTSARDATAALSRHRISALPVVDGGTVVGVVSEADLLRDAFPPDRRAHLRPPPERSGPTGTTVGEVMTSPAVTAHAATDVADVVRTMATGGFKSLPVVDDHGALVGVVSRSDLVRFRDRGDEEVRDEVVSLLRDLLHPEWRAEVADGVVTVVGPTTPDDVALAEASVASVPGVVRVTTRPSTR
ncbi:CBS domain-containing protein [Nocardioides scoriae]|uniref:CBS domain-containing protein n=1 Tax=Nocardioides scoriae TaxID=642780 RepID=A0A1H1PA09_9ACTN|nr:CBS domain-containing protein [Nocardioides scoriae]SDS08091.1 CBS domain-containing protein [Nocardioides scoriae]